MHLPFVYPSLEASTIWISSIPIMSAISASGITQLHFIGDLITLCGGEKEQPDILACANGTTIDRYRYFSQETR